MSLLAKIRHYGFVGSARIATGIGLRPVRKLLKSLRLFRLRDAPRYFNPSEDELSLIENDLLRLGISIVDYSPPPDQYILFKAGNWFPLNYHGGIASGVWDEKLLEHWIAANLLDLWKYRKHDVYVDIAACDSPWAKTLRERLGLAAYAIDMSPVGFKYRDLSYYRSENATATAFDDGQVMGASLQCAFEMFMNEDDQNLIPEFARILAPGGKAIILPLYMHTHWCAYSTPEYYGKGYSDASAKEYLRADCDGLPSSRKYDAQRLIDRVLVPIQESGMRYTLRVLRNKVVFGKGVYCHFILEIEK